MKADGLRILGWVIPMLCMAVSGWIIYRQNQELAIASQANNSANRAVEEAQQEKEKYEHLPPEKRYAAVDDVPQEQTEFLTYVRTRCAADGVNFDKWLSNSIEYGKDKQNAAMDAQTVALLKGIRKISSAITLTGSYIDIRRLVGEMESSDRLYTLSSVAWTSSKTGTTLAMTVSRYVAPPVLTIPPNKHLTISTSTPGATSTP